MWVIHPKFKKMAQEEWRLLGNAHAAKKLKCLQIPIKKWNKEGFGNIDQKIKSFEEEMARVDSLLEVGGASDVLLARHMALISQVEL